MQLRFGTSILFSALTLLKGLSGVATQSTTTTVGSISSNIEGNAFAAVFELVDESGQRQIYYYASTLTPTTPGFTSTSIQLTYNSTSQLTETEYIIEGNVGNGELSLVLTGPGHTEGPIIQATLAQSFDNVELTNVRHGYWNNFPVEFLL
ncbi:uncharacterized protein STEHIDRAFT_109627 [Stereum hirsutum FP-91666 SS1]|uniref:uncharacterized protein n=1 Tax=Stereum hirsutum (strain FP-91666) TaxID=721885 RepID=UPI00044106A9|nr:uncharacterized protein STEHIDRAFT_109627 [Stereum hirsutum FP-91666 SS1]EIM87735.1 hypothetical protein STEHIDRAFT_109627 [Stereum hirsutum FP-91666 SS1]